MKVLIDTSVWSLALRRHRPNQESPVVKELEFLIGDFRVALIGPIRQELLSGIREETHYSNLQEKLRAFPDIPLDSADFEIAARFFNLCRAKGVQGSNTDFLLCSVSYRRGMPVFSTDRDFDAYNKVLGIRLHHLEAGS